MDTQFDRVVDLLGKDQLSRALENQADLDQDLRSLLELLLSEDRAKRLESEKARIREYLKQLNEIIRQQKDVQGRTSGGGDTKKLSGEQGGLAEKTGNLANKIKDNEEGGQKAEAKARAKAKAKARARVKAKAKVKAKARAKVKAKAR